MGTTSPTRERGTSARTDHVRLAERYIGAYTARDIDAMLVLMDENVVSHPLPLFGGHHRPNQGHAGVREWWAAMSASNYSYEVVVSEIRDYAPGRVAVIGEVRCDGLRRSPWALLLRFRDGLIVESHSYFSEPAELEELGLLMDPEEAAEARVE